MDAPYVMLTTPNNGSMDVDVDIVIQIIFNHDLNFGTVNSGTLMLYDLGNAIVVNGIVQYAQKTATFTPNQPLNPSSQYQVVVIGGTNGIQDILGMTMIQNYQIAFYTSATGAPPVPTIIQPADRTLVSQPFTVAWTGGESPYDVQIATDAGFLDIYWPVSGDDISVIQTTIAGGNLIPGRTFNDGFYYVRTCSQGGAWSDVIGFAVSAVLPSVSPVGPMKLLIASPSPFAANQNATQLQLTFDRLIDPSTVGGVYIVPIPL